MSATAVFPAYAAPAQPSRATHTRIIRRTRFRGVEVDVEIDLIVDLERVTVAVVLSDADAPEPMVDLPLLPVDAPPPANRPQLGSPVGLVRSRRIISSAASSNS